MLSTITKVKNLKGKRVLLRLDLNVPIKGNRVLSDFRIKKSIQTIKFLKKAGAKIIIISHLGREKKNTLKPIAQYMNKYTRVGFVPDIIGYNARNTIENMKNASAVVLENLRKNEGEIKNDRIFAKQLANMADIYVNDAFAVSHRKNASITQLPSLLPSYIGLIFEKEIKNLSVILNPPKTTLFVLGGAKIKTKIPLLSKYINVVQNVYLGGVPANRILKEKGFETGKSVTGETDIVGIKRIAKNKKTILPVDVLVSGKSRVSIKYINEIEKGDIIVDLGKESIKDLKSLVENSSLVVLNGPLGNYEKGFDKSSVELLKIMSKSSAKTIVGGGDTALLVSNLKIEKKLTFVSTAGGAMLEFLLKGTLPGIEAIKKSSKKLI